MLEIVKIDPQVKAMREATITSYDHELKEGILDNEIFFFRTACGNAYIPIKGDKVEVEFIESERNDFIFRALKVIPKY